MVCLPLLMQTSAMLEKAEVALVMQHVIVSARNLNDVVAPALAIVHVIALGNAIDVDVLVHVQDPEIATDIAAVTSIAIVLVIDDDHVQGIAGQEEVDHGAAAGTEEPNQKVTIMSKLDY